MRTLPSAISWLFTLVFVLVLFIGCDKDTVIPQVQLISNSAMEEGSIEPTNWWSWNGDGKYTTTWTDQEAFSPEKSLEISTMTADPESYSFWAQTVSANIPKGQDVTLKVKIKGDLFGAGVSIVIRGDDGDVPSGNAEQFATTEGVTSITGSFDWKDYSVTLSDVGDDIKSLTIYLIYLPNTTGEVYFDDVTLSN